VKPPPRSLFRQEAIDAQREKLLGEISTVRPVPAWAFTALAVAVASGLVALAFLGQYTRRERVEGYLELDAGAARISAGEAGVIKELRVREGEEVVQGQTIARLGHGSTTSTGVDATKELLRELSERRLSVEAELAQARRLADQQLSQARKRVDDLGNEIAQGQAEIQAQTQRLVSAQQEAQRYHDLARSGFASGAMVHERDNDVLDQTTKLEGVRRSLASTEGSLRAAQAEIPLIETRSQSQVKQLEQRLSELEQKLLEADVKAQTLISAPIDGTVTNIVHAEGDSVPADAAIATILPRGSGLHAELLVPTRAIGFIQPGNRVVMRYEAFPFQRFGQYEGTVTSVGGAVWSAGEKIGPIALREPAYRIEVRLASQSVQAGGQQLRLHPGMLLGADILLEKRTLFEWIFEPVLALRERLR